MLDEERKLKTLEDTAYFICLRYTLSGQDADSYTAYFCILLSG
jgi:hypothetical protein